MRRPACHGVARDDFKLGRDQCGRYTVARQRQKHRAGTRPEGDHLRVPAIFDS